MPVNFNYKGAMYPWQTIDGTEDCIYWEYAYFEIHINAIVPYAIYLYTHVTGDRQFLFEKGKKMKRIMLVMLIFAVGFLLAYILEMDLGEKGSGGVNGTSSTDVHSMEMFREQIKVLDSFTAEAKIEEMRGSFEFLRRWKPCDASGGFGADILLRQDLTERELIVFVQNLTGDYNPVIVRIWTSRIAYYDEDARTPEFKTDYLLFYVKNTTNKGPFRGCNEIRWMQEKGKFSSKFGTKTRF